MLLDYGGVTRPNYWIHVSSCATLANLRTDLSITWGNSLPHTLGNTRRMPFSPRKEHTLSTSRCMCWIRMRNDARWLELLCKKITYTAHRRDCTSACSSLTFTCGMATCAIVGDLQRNLITIVPRTILIRIRLILVSKACSVCIWPWIINALYGDETFTVWK